MFFGNHSSDGVLYEFFDPELNLVGSVTIAELVEEILGQGCYMRLDALSHLLNEERSINTAALKIDPKYANAYQNRAALRRKLGQTAEADADLATAQKLRAPGK